MLPIKFANARQRAWLRPLLAASLFAGAMGFVPEASAIGTGKGRPASRPETLEGTSLLGSYLAGHIARSERDSDSAAYYYRRALARDPTNQEILNDAFQLELAAGNFDSARNLAQRLLRKQSDNTIAHIFLGLDAFRQKNFLAADEHFRIAERVSSAEEPTVKLARAWVAIAQGRPDKAIALVQSPSKAAWATHFETVQRAFMGDVAKKKAVAAEAYKIIYGKKPPNTRVAEAYARHLAVWGDKELASKVLTESGADATPLGKQLAAELKAGKTPKLMVSNAEEGLAEAFLGIGQVLAANNGVDAAQIYLRLALFLNPSSDIAKLELAELYGSIEHYSKSLAVLDGIREQSPFWINSRVRKAVYLNALQKTDDAVGLLQGLLEKHPKDEQILQTLASIEAARKKYDAAIPYYNRVIALIETPERKHWQLFYARGIAYERTKQWDKAEPDFKKALELDPEQGAVLNYLGYSWLDQNMNIAEAFDLIKKAVKLRPNDGYIIDSLGWGYYIQKDYEQAVKQLDKAVELRPEDPTLNDHLGDVYWRLGRKLEAKFQWNQALTLNPEPEEAAKIKKKLEVGLPDEAGAHAGLEVSPASPEVMPSDHPGKTTASPEAGAN
ncbi:MAG TPA: tetratricopeptide repeat protein [Hyphomicrobiales bacterium]|nr:tetratricopeptide repeat protein [Hyphomicrobiales bacterium]